MADPMEGTQKEIQAEIHEKLKLIKENLLVGRGPEGRLAKISMLSDINDGLSDVLLEFDTDLLDSQFNDESF